MAYVGAGQNKYTVFPLENYTFGNKAPKVEKQRNLEARFKHLKDKYATFSFTRNWFDNGRVHRCGSAVSDAIVRNAVQVCRGRHAKNSRGRPTGAPTQHDSRPSSSAQSILFPTPRWQVEAGRRWYSSVYYCVVTQIQKPGLLSLDPEFNAMTPCRNIWAAA